MKKCQENVCYVFCFLKHYLYCRMLKMNLTELKMHCTALEQVDHVSINAVLTTLSAVVRAWEKQQRDIEKKKQDDEALYVTK